MELSLDEMKERLHLLEKRIANAKEKAGRISDNIKLIWVSKFHTREAVEKAISLGATEFGENRAQEADWEQESQQRQAYSGQALQTKIDSGA